MSQLQANRDTPEPSLIDSIERRCVASHPEAPRLGLFLFGSASPAELEDTLSRVDRSVGKIVEEITVFPELAGEKQVVEAASRLAQRVRPRLRVQRSPGDHGYGAARKAAFDHAVRVGFDHVVVLRSDGRQPPEALPQLLHAALVEGHDLVIGARQRQSGGARRGGRAAFVAFGRSGASWFRNRTLGIRLHDHDSGYRVYSVRALRAVPFQLAHDGRIFDVDLAIQHRALGLTARELPVSPAWREAETARDGLSHALLAGWRAIEYRLHQLHLIRRGRHFVDRRVHYTLKESDTGSHMQVLQAIAPRSRVLDLGCSQGLLAGPLRQKQVRVTGVDAAPPEWLAEELEAYHRRDLELPLELPVRRDFDYVVVADVIEHVRNRDQLLSSARRYLKPDGRLIISTPNIALWFYRLSLLVGRFEYGPRGVLDHTHVRLYTRDSFRREVEGAGFHVLEERFTSLPFEVVFESTGRSRLMRAIAGAYHGLARLWPAMFAYQFILLAEIRILDQEAEPAPDGAADE